MPSFQTPPANHPDVRYSTNPVLEPMQPQWLFSAAEILRAPSILDGMFPALESANRSKGVNFITQVGILLKLPQLTLATASVYLHRFFMRHSMVDLPNRPGLHHYSVAATALFLATKVEENCRKMRELVVACCRVAQKQPNLVVDEQSKEYWKWRDTILHNEDLLLEALCFDLQLEQPYKILYDFLCHYRVQENKHLRNTSWAFLNDSHLTMMCLLHSPRTVAGSAFYAGARFADLAFPDDENGRPWWEQLDLDIFEIQRACNLMAEVYENSTLPHQNQKEAYIKEHDDSMFDKTRSAATPGHSFSPAGSIGAESQGVKRDRDEYIRGDQNGTTGRDGSMQPSNPTRDELRSPKRQRQTSLTSNDSGQQNGNGFGPSARESRQSNGEGIDDVQQKIDDIVNAAKATKSSHPQPPQPLVSRQSSNSQITEVPYPHPPLPRRPSNPQQPPWPGPPPRRRSSSISNRTRPPSAHDSSQTGPVDYRSSSARPPSFDRSVGGARGSYDRDSWPPQDRRQEEPPARATYRQENQPSEDNHREDVSGRNGYDTVYRPPQEYGQSDQNHSLPQQPPRNEQPVIRPAPAAISNWSAEVDDSEKVDYGSEEGEL